jgi:hypothetical protein
LSPLTSRQDSPEMIVAWLVFAILCFGFLGIRAMTRPKPSGPQRSIA